MPSIEHNACTLKIGHNLLISQPIFMKDYFYVNAKVGALNTENASLIVIVFLGGGSRAIAENGTCQHFASMNFNVQACQISPYLFGISMCSQNAL